MWNLFWILSFFSEFLLVSQVRKSEFWKKSQNSKKVREIFFHMSPYLKYVFDMWP